VDATRVVGEEHRPLDGGERDDAVLDTNPPAFLAAIEAVGPYCRPLGVGGSRLELDGDEPLSPAAATERREPRSSEARQRTLPSGETRMAAPALRPRPRAPVAPRSACRRETCFSRRGMAANGDWNHPSSGSGIVPSCERRENCLRAD